MASDLFEVICLLVVICFNCLLAYDSRQCHKFRQNLVIFCMQFLLIFGGSRLKLGNGFQYGLNAKGSTPAEIMGIDYKSTLKPSLDSYLDDIKKSSVDKLEELISLQKQSSELSAQIEGKRNYIATLQSHIDEVSGSKLSHFSLLCIGRE